MSKQCDLSFQQKSLFQQGYQQYSPQELKQLEWGLRFTPGVCSVITALALFYQLPYVLFVVAALGIWAFFYPAKHPMDLIYNHAVRHLFTATKLPENPFQRRLACFAAGIMNTVAGILFLLNMPMAAYAVGGMLLFLQAIVIFTHFCTLSWMYEGVMRLLGKWNQPIDINEARELLKQGATLIDVRSPGEYAKDSVDGAVNIPLEELHLHAHKIAGKQCVVFCNSGTRSHIAKQKLLNDHGHEAIFNVGQLDRAKQLAAANTVA
jgi:rhodanese-related sulfurtransferase